MKRYVTTLLALLASVPAAAEPLSRAEAVARARERNPSVLRSLADREGLRGRAREARADALPELNVYGSFLRSQDPGFFNSPTIDEFPPDVLQAFRPIPSNLWGGSVALEQTLWSFSLGKAIRAAGHAEKLGDENVRSARQDIALRAVYAYNAYLLALGQVAVAEKVVQQKLKHLEMAKNRLASGVATELEVLRFEVALANARTTLLRLSGASDLARGELNAVMLNPTDTPIEPTDSLEFVDEAADQRDVVREASASRPEVKAVSWNEKIYDEAIGIYKADMQPRLDLDADFGWSTRDTSNFFESNYKSWKLGVTLKIPVFDGWRTCRSSTAISTACGRRRCASGSPRAAGASPRRRPTPGARGTSAGLRRRTDYGSHGKAMPSLRISMYRR